MDVPNFFLTMFPKRTGINLVWPKMANNQEDWYKFGMAKNGHFFPTIFPKKTGINLEWPKMVVPNFLQQFFPERLKFGQKCLFQSFSDNVSQKDWYKFGMAKNGCFNFFLTIFPKRTGINLEWKKWPFHIIFQQCFSRRLVQIWNGQKWPFWIFSNNFSLIDWHKLGMAKNGCSNFFLTIFLKKTGIN